MNGQLKKKINYFPYKIFQRNCQYNNNKKLPIFNCSEISGHKKIVINISKNLKSVAISNKLFANYMDNYINLTQDHCFKSPDKDSYPIRKNLRYLSTSSIKNIKNLSQFEKKKVLKRPISVNTNYTRLKILNKDNINNFYYVNHTKNRNNKSDLLLSLSEGGFLKTNNINNSEINNNIDLDNNKNIKMEHFEYLKSYINKINSLNEIFDKTQLSITNTLLKKNVQYKLSIYSLCLKFRLISNIKSIHYKLYLPFKYLPIFYLIDYQTFKLFLSEIIYYDNKSQQFSFIKSNFEQIINKYCDYIKLNINLNNLAFINDMTFYKNEFHFPLFYKWFVYIKDINNSNNDINLLIKNIVDNNKEENEEKTMLFELKIELPKIKFNILEYETKIKNLLKKSLMIQLMKTNFTKWDELILFELFFIKKFRHIINSLLKKNTFYKQKIYLISNYNSKNKNSIIKTNINKSFEFFISKTNDNYSKYYIFNPYIITLFKKINKYYQEIHLTLRESEILYKFGKYWGLMNTLLKCININNEINNKNMINFKFDLLENISPNFLKINEKKNKDKKEQMKFKFNKMDITIHECALKTIVINNSEKVEKFFKIPQKLLKLILVKKNKAFLNENKITEYFKEIIEEKIIEIKKDNKKALYDKELENSNKLINEDIPIANKTDSKYMKKESKNINNNINKIILNQSKDRDSRDRIRDKDKKARNSKLFLTKDFNNNNEENISNEKGNGHISISPQTYKKRKPNVNKTLYLIKSKEELVKNRTIRDNYLLNNEISISKIKTFLMNSRNKKAKTFRK